MAPEVVTLHLGPTPTKTLTGRNLHRLETDMHCNNMPISIPNISKQNNLLNYIHDIFLSLQAEDGASSSVGQSNAGALKCMEDRSEHSPCGVVALGSAY